MENYYEILGILPEASDTQIRKAYRTLCKSHHPGTGGEEKQFLLLQEAYEILIDPDRRESYDRLQRENVARQEERMSRKEVESIDIITKLEIILGFSAGSRVLRPDFAYSVLQQISNGMKISPKQIAAIDNIIVSFRIDLSIWLDETYRHDRLNVFYKKLEASMEKKKYKDDEQEWD